MLARLEMIVRWIPGSCFSARAGREGISWKEVGTLFAPQKDEEKKTVNEKVQLDLMSLGKTRTGCHVRQGPFSSCSNLKVLGPAGLLGGLEWTTQT